MVYVLMRRCQNIANQTYFEGVFSTKEKALAAASKWIYPELFYILETEVK